MGPAVTTLKGLRTLRLRLRAERDASRAIGFDTEWDSPTIEHRGKRRPDGLRATIVGYSVAIQGESDGRYVPLAPNAEIAFAQPSSECVVEFEAAARLLLGDFLRDPTMRVYAHNVKGELHALRRAGIEPACRWMDSELLCWLAGWRLPGKGGLKLKAQMHARFGQRRPDFTEVAQGRQPSTVPLDELAPYAAQDARDTLTLGLAALERCKDLDLAGQWALDAACIPVTAEMESCGVPLDEAALLGWATECESELVQLEQRFAELTHTTVALPTKVREHVLCGCMHEGLPPDGACQTPGCVSGFIHYKNGKPKLRTVERNVPTPASAHPGNDHQVARWLFDELRFWPTAGHVRTKGPQGTWSTAEEHLRPFTALPGPAGECARLRLRYQALRKYASTYTRALVSVARQHGDGCLHSTFRQDGTDTQRYSSSGPNLQNLPSSERQDLPWLQGLPDPRAAFLAPEGWVVVIRDLSQIELRVVAHYSCDPALVKLYQQGGDIHANTMATIRGGCSRRSAKVTIFSSIYRITARTLCRKLQLATNDFNITEADAQRFIDGTFRAYPGIPEMHEDLIRRAERAGYAETLTGFKRPLSEWGGRRRWSTENQAINTPIQGTAGGLIKRAMVSVYHRWDSLGLLGDPLRRAETAAVRLVAQEHDSLVVCCKESLADLVDADLAEAFRMCGPELLVPLDSSGGRGKSWAAAKGA